MNNPIEIIEKDKIDPILIREKICEFEKELAKTENAVIGNSDIAPLKHTFADGIYVREIFLPKGFVCTGKIHLHSHPNFLMEGDVSVMTEFSGVQRLIAPFYCISPANTKRLVYANEDSIWVTVHANPDNDTDIDILEKQLVADDYLQIEGRSWKELI